MNTSPANLNPASATQSKAGKSREAESDAPFSQVLSSEIAQGRRADAPSPDKKTDTAKDATLETDEADLATAMPAVKAESVKIAAAFDLLRTETAPISAEAFLTPGLAAGQVSGSALTLADPSSASLTGQPEGRQAGRGLSKGQLSKALHAAQPGNAPAGSQKSDPALSAKGESAFIGQLAAARQSDSTRTGESLTDLLSNTTLRATPHAAMEAPTPTSGAAASRLAPSVGTAAWGQALGEKVVWMAAGSQQTASLTLNPPNLGPLQIVLNISNEQATASFFSAQPEVRQALEAAFPRLREMMSEAGIQLGQATVSADTPQHQPADSRSQPHLPSFSGGDEHAPVSLQALHGSLPQSGRGLVDTFA